VRLYAEIQSSAVEAVKEGHSYLLRRQGELHSTQKTFRLLEGTAQAMTRSAERLQYRQGHPGDRYPVGG
jgi:hypothetical protein